MKKFMKKASKILCLALIVLMVTSPLTLASEGFKSVTPTDTPASEAMSNIGGQALGIVQALAYAIAVIMVLVVGIQYMIATPAKKAELKGKLWSMAIGAILIASAGTILGFVAGLGEGALETVGAN